MAKQKQFCSVCNKALTLKSETVIGAQKLLSYDCGHSFLVDPSAVSEDITYETIVSASGFKPFPYQIKTAQHIEESGFRDGVFHEQGLGKTICSLLPVIVHPDKLLPLAVLCKAGLVRQWAVQCQEWLGDLARIQVINTGFTPAFPPDGDGLDLLDEGAGSETGPNCYIISMDSLKSNKFIRTGIPWVQYIIIDECQAIKNTDSKRTIAVQNFVRGKQYISALSGTPFKNNASEYFPILNILNPALFHDREAFLRYEVNSYYSGRISKFGGLRNPEKFKEKTKSFIIRYTRDEVLPDLPKINRQYHFVDVADAIKDEYDKELDHFSNLFDSSENTSVGTNHELRASLFKLWHITGIAKIPAVADEAIDFLIENPEKKLVIFKHHNDVGDILELRINAAIKANSELSETTNPCLRLETDNPKKDEYSELSTKIHWISRDPKDRVVIASTRYGGEGWNLQTCADMIMAERQFTPMDEEQCEGRFSRPGATATAVFNQIFSAVGTVDDFFYSLVEKKRNWFHEAMSGKKSDSPAVYQQSMMQELADALASFGRKKFKR